MGRRKATENGVATSNGSNGASTSTTSSTTTTSSSSTTATSSNYHVLWSSRFVWLSILGASLTAFATGRVCQILFVLPLIRNGEYATTTTTTTSSVAEAHGHYQSYITKSSQWSPIGGEEMIARSSSSSSSSGNSNSGTISYSSKVFDSQATTESACESTLLGRMPNPAAAASTSTATAATASAKDDKNEMTNNNKTTTPLPPAGFHISIDLQDVDKDLVDSMEHLQYVMLQIAQKASMPLLSYHCMSFQPNGKSCVAISLESHIGFHTCKLC